MIGIGISIPMMMPFAEDATAFVRSGVLRSPFTITRAQTGGVQSSAVNGGNNGLTFYGADVPRFTGSAQRLLIEGQRTNGIRNPRGEGAVAGTPGTAPTNWFLSAAGGVNFNIVGTGTENDLPYVDIRLSGTSTTGESPLIRADLVYPVASVGQVWTHSMYARLIAGTLTGITNFNMFVTEWTSGGAFLNQSFSSFTLASGSLIGARLSHIRTLTGATAGLAGSQFSFSVSVGVPIDCTFRVAAPQLELGAFASSPILPPVGTPGASTRGDDRVSASLASLGIAANGACTALWSGVVPNFIVGGNHTIVCIDNGTVGNGYEMRISQSFGELLCVREQGGSNVISFAGAVTSGQKFKCGMSPDGAGRLAVSLNGNAVVSATISTVGSPTQFRLGNIANASTPMWGETELLRILPYSVSDAELQSLTGALP